MIILKRIISIFKHFSFCYLFNLLLWSPKKDRYSSFQDVDDHYFPQLLVSCSFKPLLNLYHVFLSLFCWSCKYACWICYSIFLLISLALIMSFVFSILQVVFSCVSHKFPLSLSDLFVVVIFLKTTLLLTSSLDILLIFVDRIMSLQLWVNTSSVRKSSSYCSPGD